MKRLPDLPLPYTEAYNKDSKHIVNKDRIHVPYSSLSFIERLARSGSPWCLKNKGTET